MDVACGWIDKKHLVGALLHPLYRKLTYVSDYQRSKTHIYVRELIAELIGTGMNPSMNNATVVDQPKKKNTEPLKINSSTQMMTKIISQVGMQRQHKRTMNWINI